MILTRNSLCIFCLAILLAFGALSTSTGAQPISRLELDSRRVSWTELSFHAKNFWVEVSTEIQLRTLPASDLDAVLLASPEGVPVKPKTSQTSELKINTTIDPRFRPPVKIHNRIWFDPTDASALGRVRLRRGEDDFKKIYRFTDRGVFRHRREPKSEKETLKEPERWTDVKDSFYPYDLPRLGCNLATERSLLIYILSAAQLSTVNNSASLCVFGKRQLHRVKLRREGTYPIRVNFVEKTKQNQIRKQERINAIKIAIETEPMESDLSETENFSFLGLHKDISIYIDPTSHLPIQVGGIISTIGSVTLNLHDVSLQN